VRKETYTNKAGKTRYRPVVRESDLYGDESLGFCIACGKTAYGVEPDARRYTCEHCDEALVYGLEELILMGIATVQAPQERKRRKS
jgi:hypothetical protein